MSIRDFLTQDHKLPPFATYRSALLWALGYVLLPNVSFWIVAWANGLARPIINLDYLLPLLLLVLPVKWGKILGYVVLVCTILVDWMMFAMQIFPFLDMAAIRYLLPFIDTAPARIIWIVGAALIYMLLFPMIQNTFFKKTSWKFVVPMIAVMGLLGWNVRVIQYKETNGLRFGTANYFYAQSQIWLYWSEIGDVFYQLTHTEPKLVQNSKENATRLFSQPFSNKILLVVAESWGVSRQPEVHRTMLENIYNQKDKFEFLKEGFFDFAGATVQGEMRELCNVNTENGYAFGKLPAENFANCLPNILKKQSYQTVGLHGASSILYDRNSWYPKVGFQKVLFGEHLLNLQKCYAFNGVCDKEMLDVVGNEFKQAGNRKIFVYWLTLTAHLPYSVSDMRSNRFDCDKLQVTVGDICNNMRLQSQLFDDLGELIKQPEMKGVEVMVVGDHMPPIMGNVPLYQNLRWNDVPYIYFKIK